MRAQEIIRRLAALLLEHLQERAFGVQLGRGAEVRELVGEAIIFIFFARKAMAVAAVEGAALFDAIADLAVTLPNTLPNTWKRA